MIASVVYVGLEVRQSAHQASQGNAIERARASREVGALRNDIFLQASDDPAFAAVVRKGLADFSSLPDEDKSRLEIRFLAPSAMSVTSVHFAAEDGLVDKQFADSAFDYLASLLTSPGATAWWDTV